MKKLVFLLPLLLVGCSTTKYKIGECVAILNQDAVGRIIQVNDGNLYIVENKNTGYIAKERQITSVPDSWCGGK